MLVIHLCYNNHMKFFKKIYARDKQLMKHPDTILAVWIAVGILFGVAIDNVAVGIAVGVAIGASLRASKNTRSDISAQKQPEENDVE